MRNYIILILLIIVIIFAIKIVRIESAINKLNNNNIIEGLDSNHPLGSEALQNIASIYNKGKLI